MTIFFHKKTQKLLIFGINTAIRRTIALMKAGIKDKSKRIALALAGLAVGALNGFLGGGGGMITVPALTLFGGLETKKAHATAIAVMLPLSVISAVIYTLGGVWHVRLGLVSGIAVSVGGALGAVLLSRLNNIVVALVFYLLMTAAGVGGIVKWFG